MAVVHIEHSNGSGYAPRVWVNGRQVESVTEAISEHRAGNVATVRLELIVDEVRHGAPPAGIAAVWEGLRAPRGGLQYPAGGAGRTVAAMTKPTTARTGDRVLYTLSEADANAINKRRDDASAAYDVRSELGYVVHIGNSAAAGKAYPADVVEDWGGAGPSVNLQVVLDGNDTYWATSRVEGDEGEPGTWRHVPLRLPQG
jgi:hypothetical protein